MQKARELGLGERALVGAARMRALIALQSVERMRRNVAAPERVTEDAAERAKDAFDRPGRETGSMEFARDRGDIVGSDQGDASLAEPPEKMQSQLRTVEVDCPLTPRAGGYLRLELA